MNRGQLAWYLSPSLHYAYLISSVIFLLIINFTDESSILSSCLFVIHFILLIWRMFFENSFLEFFFKIRKRKAKFQQRLSDQTLKFDPSSNPRMRSRYNQQDNDEGVESFLFGRNQNRGYQRNQNTHDLMMRPGCNQYTNANTRHQNPMRSRSTRGVDRFRNYSPQNNNAQINQYSDNQASPLANQRGMIKFQDTNMSNFRQLVHNNRYKQPGYLQQNQRLDNYSNLRTVNPQNRSQVNDSSRNSWSQIKKGEMKFNIRPLQSEFQKLNISKQTAAQMIIYVGKYFKQQLQQYKILEKQTLDKLIVLIQKTTQRKYRYDDSESLIQQAKRLVEQQFKRQRHSSEKVNQFISKYIDEIISLLQNLYFQKILKVSSTLELIKFYKTHIERYVLPEISIQIINSQIAHPNQGMNDGTEKVYYNTFKDFCFYHENQYIHPYNIEETYLFILLKYRYLAPSRLLNELSIIANKKSYEIY